jgi:hypothetical protein
MRLIASAYVPGNDPQICLHFVHKGPPKKITIDLNWRPNPNPKSFEQFCKEQTK